METTFQTAMAKLTAAEKALEVLASDRTKDSAWNYGGGAKEQAGTCLNAVRQAMLALQEAAGTVEVERQEYTVVETQGVGRMRELRENHESFGVVEISRPTGRTRLVGTVADALPTSIRIQVSRAVRYIDPDLHTERYFHTGVPILEFEMSVYQWAEAITQMGGHMNPCTLRRVHGVRMDNVPERMTTPLEQIINDTKKKLSPEGGAEAFKAAVEAVLAKLPSLKLSKKKKEELEAEIRALYTKHIDAPVQAQEWATRRFTEDTEKAISTAKVEMEAALTSLISSTGLAALRGELKGFEGVSLTPSLDAKKDEES